MWKRLEIEEDDPADGTSWYLINCIAGVELDLLNMCRYVCADFPTETIEKFVVPTSRHLRSHGDKRKVVDVRVRYPGYVFCKMRMVEDAYETIQELELTRSWMGTVNKKGHKKLPPAPVPLNYDEVEKFQGLEDAQEEFEEAFAGDYTGRNDTGADLLAQYAGYDVGQMVKVLKGRFTNEDGTVRRLKDGQLFVRMFTYGQTFDDWFDVDAIRPLTDLEAMRGLSGPTVPVDQDQFDVSIGAKDPSELESPMGGESGLRSGLMQDAGDRGQRNRREDRVARGDTGGIRDAYGRNVDEVKKEEDNWLAYREQQRANARGGPSAAEETHIAAIAAAEAAAAPAPMKKKQKPKGDTWGITERSSWTGGEFGFDADTEKEEEARRQRNSVLYEGRENNRVRGDLGGRGGRGDSRSEGRGGRGGRGDFGGRGDADRDRSGRGREQTERRPVREARGGWDGGGAGQTETTGGEDWTPPSPAPGGDSKEDDFFSNLMSELSDDLDDGQSSSGDGPRTRGTRHHDSAGPSTQSQGEERRPERRDDSDDFFANLMNELGDSLEEPASSSSSSSSRAGDEGPGGKFTPKDSDDDFFASLESELSASLGDGAPSEKDGGGSDIDDDAFFDALESEIQAAKKKPKDDMSEDDFDFFANLGKEMKENLNSEPPKNDISAEDDFFATLEKEMKETLDTPSATPSGGKAAPEEDFFASLEREMEETLDAPLSSGGGAPKETLDLFDSLIDEVAEDIAMEESLNSKRSAKAAVQPSQPSGDFSSMTVPQLKDVLRTRGLKVGGKKAELIERLKS